MMKKKILISSLLLLCGCPATMLAQESDRYMRYYTTFTSLKETFGYKTPEAWFAYIREWKNERDHPVKVTVK